ncbi:MAG: protease modulator HflC, partial [Alphaproteobacteria bacterium]
MIGRITRSPIALAFVAILLLIIVGSTLAVVPETKQVVIVRFGVPNRTINRYQANAPYGQTGA